MPFCELFRFPFCPFLSVFSQPSLPLPFSLVAIISAEMATPGRRLDDVSKFFHRDASKRPNVKATCKGCGKTMQYIPDRLKAHVQVCDKANKLFPDIEVEIKSSSSSSSQPFFPPSSTSQDLSPASPEGQPPLKKPFLLQARLPVSSLSLSSELDVFFEFFRSVVSLLPPTLIFAGGKRRVYQA